MTTRFRACTLALACLLGACASSSSRAKTADAALDGAELAVERAQEAHVGDYDALDLRHAREKLMAARQAAKQPDSARQARWLAEEAAADAELAAARARAARAKAVSAELQRRQGGDAAAAAPGA
jgi:Skp family chaperone for outer membrane proteins